MKIKTTTLLLIILASIFSCQSETAKKNNADQPITFANFYVRYMEAEKRIKATAVFDSGKNEKESTSLKIENGVFFHNANMKERKIENIGVRYNYEMDGEFSDNFKFRFTEPSNGKMNYEVKINPIKNIAIPNGISKSKGMNVTWTGTPLAENESLAFLIKGKKGKPILFELEGKTAIAQITVPAEKVKNLDLGAAQISVVRKQFLKSEESNFVAQCSTEFYAHEIDITVVP